MAKYWVFLNNQVKGPYEVDQLIRLPGFSRQTMVSVDDQSGGAGKWTSPADIPDLARIFQKVDELHDAPVPGPRPTPKPQRPRMPAKLTPVAPPMEAPSRFSGAWIWALIFSALIAGGVFRWNQIIQRQQRIEERQMAQALIELAPLPSTSLYSSLRQYLQTKQISPRWAVERTPAGLCNVTASWSSPEKVGEISVYAFEANLQAQSVRGLNSAAIKLLAEGFPPPSAAKPAPVAAKSKKSSGDAFPGAIDERRQAFEQGDFDAVWDMFSRRRKNEMEQGGITSSGFIRMQKLTYRPGSNVQQTIVKTKVDSENARLVLLRQAQPRHPDMYIKQSWIWEDNAWRLDDEEKKMANAIVPPGTETSPTENAPVPPPTRAAAPASSAASSNAPAKPIPTGLPGFSDMAK